MGAPKRLQAWRRSHRLILNVGLTVVQLQAKHRMAPGLYPHLQNGEDNTNPPNGVVMNMAGILFFKKNLFYYFMRIDTLSTCMRVHHTCAWCPQRVSRGTVVTDGSELPHGCQGWDPGPLEG